MATNKNYTLKYIVSLLFVFIQYTQLAKATSNLKTDSLTVQLKYAANTTVKIKTLWELSDYYWSDDIRKAIEYAEQALELADKTKDKRLIGISHQKLGNALLLTGDNYSAQKNYLKSLTLLENTNDEEALFSLYHNIGVLYDRMEDYDKALLFYEKALFIYNNSADKNCLVMQQVHSLYNSIGNIYVNKHDRANALEYYNKALASAENKNDYQALGVIYNNIGKQYFDNNQNTEALHYYNLSLDYRQKVHDLNGMAKSHNSLCSYYLKTANYHKARESAFEALRLSESSGAKTTRLTALKQISEIEEATNDCKSALSYYKQYKLLNNNFTNEETIKKQTEIEIRADYEKQEEIKNTELAKKNIITNMTIFTLLSGVIIFLLLYLLTKNRTKRINLEKITLEQDLRLRNQDIHTKDKELASSVLYLLEKNELLNNISEQLLNLKKRIDPQHHSAIQKIILDIQEGSRADMWDEFELRFQQVHDEYFKKLKAVAPDLTPGEIKICSFLKLNMTSKEISAITRQSIKSIEVARTRIRKKLQLTNHDINLVTYLMEL